MNLRLLFQSAFLLLTTFVNAQIDSLEVVKLQAVEVTATKISNSLPESTWSVSKLDFEPIQDQMQQLSFSEYVHGVPGLFVLNSNNFSQDLRISIRGFGARSAFGIRGIKILVDGIPETTPDGQGQIDNLSLGSISSVEVIRGPSSVLYGNASGGVLSINTKSDFDRNYVKPALTLGRFGMQNVQIEAGLKNKNTSFIILANKIKTNGYRSQSAYESSGVNARIKHEISSKTKLNLLFNYTDSPLAEDPGGLDFESTQVNRLQARDANLTYKTKESVNQIKGGISLTHNFNSRLKFSTYAFKSSRDFDAKLPFSFGGSVYLDRKYSGNGAQISYKPGGSIKGHNLQLGYSYAEQSDLRKRYVNNRGANGDLTLIQDESFNALGFYLLDEISFGKYKLLGGLRYDKNELSVLDYFISNGNDSGFISMNSWNYSLGLNYKINEKSYLFSSLGTSFETPALSELSANPNGGGFNSLIPQKAHNKEIGYRFYAQKNEFEIVLFDINTSNDLVPYEIESSPGRTFYRNAGKTNRTGLELSFSRQTKEYLNTKFTYTYSNFSYGSFQKGDVDLSGKTLPGIPKHMASITTTLVRGGWNASLTSRFQGALFADDANEVKEQGFFVSNLNVSFQNGKGKVAWIPFFGVNNLWNSIYNDNIRLNAFGGRYYEPAPTRYVFGGVRVKL